MSNKEKEEAVYHIPAMLNECIEGLNIKSSGIYVDATFGGGGHSRGILKQLGENGHLYGFDQDEDAKNNIINDKRFTFVRSNFRYLTNFMRYHNVKNVDGIIADLGVSSHHFDDKERGFSFRFESDLDMRMNNKARLTAAHILNTYSENGIADVLYNYGEIRTSRKIAASIVKTRETKLFVKVSDLLDILIPFGGKSENKKFFAQVFQALRIEVNQEIEVLKEFLVQSLDILKPGGRLAVISYHSLEDRLVKNFIKTGNFEGKVENDLFGNKKTPLHAVCKMIIPSEQEREDNPRVRSAKLRIAEKV
jgi:16S rRNA (cytosine1402-N4)-methyltransferase